MMDDGTPTRWIIGVDPWIIQDGNYGEFSVGDTAEFALEFCPFSLQPDAPGAKAYRPARGAMPWVRGEVVLAQPGLWMLDFGVRAYHDGAPPAGVRADRWMMGEIYLGIDPFVYMDRHARRDDVPPAIYTWRIAGIRERTAPQPPPGVHVTYGEFDWSERDVAETDAWNEPPGRVLSYELVCERLDVPPKRTRAF